MGKKAEEVWMMEGRRKKEGGREGRMEGRENV